MPGAKQPFELFVPGPEFLQDIYQMFMETAAFHHGLDPHYYRSVDELAQDLSTDL